MTKQLSMIAALVFAVACKTDAPSPKAAASSDGTSAKARSAKIDVKPLQPPAAPAPGAPALPAPPGDTSDPANPVMEQWRDRGDPRGERRRLRDARLDKDGDGIVSGAEREAARLDRMTNIRERLDTDGDGKLTPAEIANGRGRMRFDDPQAIDTNHDGDISTEELQEAFRARREQRREARGSAASPGSAAP